MYLTMRSGFIICFLALVVLMTACDNSGQMNRKDSEKAGDSSSASYAEVTGLSAEPLLQQADSLQMIYYDNPGGDSLRYTRFYHYTITKDTSTINQLLNNLRLPVQPQNEVRQCRSEGKIYVFGEREDPIKTIYFSTRCDTCCYLYYIKEGVFYYTPLTDNFKNKLKENKALSRRP